MDNRRAPAVGRCLCGEACTRFEPGHELHAIRACAASSMSSHWIDAVVVEASPDGTLWIEGVYADWSGALWHHTDLSDSVEPGEPVAFQETYGVLAIRGELVSVRPLDGVAGQAA